MYIQRNADIQEQRIKVVIADDHPVLLDGLLDLFSGEDNLEIVGTATCANSSVNAVAQYRPNIAILDLSMPGDVPDAISQIAKVSTKTRVIIFTAYCSIDSAVKTLQNGALGFILKGASFHELLDAVDAVLSGHMVISQQYAADILAAFRKRSPASELYDVAQFTSRELEIIANLLQGATNREIAERLSLTEKTVKHYMTNLMVKMRARNRLEVAIRAREQNLVDMPNSTETVIQFDTPLAPPGLGIRN